MATIDDKKIIFSMVGLTKTIKQTNKTILKNIYLSFFYSIYHVYLLKKLQDMLKRKTKYEEIR